jgi:hypothetical protein
LANIYNCISKEPTAFISKLQNKTSPKRYYLFTTIHGITFQDTTICEVKAVKTSNLTHPILFLCLFTNINPAKGENHFQVVNTPGSEQQIPSFSSGFQLNTKNKEQAKYQGKVSTLPDHRTLEIKNHASVTSTLVGGERQI